MAVFISWVLIVLLGCFIIGQVVSIIKTLKSRRRAARDQNKHDEKEVDQSNHQ